ncbi:hypothetical protein VTK73DRAFT_1474 [Phialemonium thermophilum]|uniref:Conidiation-specific protein 6 n=1 Tax=Phialemonium thermophilum TaxID=223376 RepID=A0ABR3X939_9PEZI
MTDPSEEINVLRGHKATLNNPRVLEQAKENSRQVLENMGVDPSERARQGSGSSVESGGGGYQAHREDLGGKDPGNVARGLKATINNPRVSEEAKQHAREQLEGEQ